MRVYNFLRHGWTTPSSIIRVGINVGVSQEIRLACKFHNTDFIGQTFVDFAKTQNKTIYIYKLGVDFVIYFVMYRHLGFKILQQYIIRLYYAFLWYFISTVSLLNNSKQWENNTIRAKLIAFIEGGLDQISIKKLYFILKFLIKLALK